LLEFLLRAAYSHGRWRPAGTERELQRERALERWYRRSGPP